MRRSSTRRLSLGAVGLVAVVAIGAACTPVPPSGPPPVLEIAPPAAALTDTPSGVGTTQTFTVTNSGTGDSGALDVSVVSVTGTGTWSVGNDVCDGQALEALDPDDTCTFVIQYENNTGAGAGQAQVVVVDTTRPSVSVTADLSGTGEADPPPSPAALSITPAFAPLFTDTPSGAGDTVEFTITNFGGTSTGPLGVFVFEETGFGGFVVVSENCAGVGLAAGSSCTVTVQYENNAGDGSNGFAFLAVEDDEITVGILAAISRLEGHALGDED